MSGYGYVLTYGATAVASPIMASKGIVITSAFIPLPLMSVFLTCGKSGPSKCNSGQFCKMEQGAVSKTYLLK